MHARPTFGGRGRANRFVVAAVRGDAAAAEYTRMSATKHAGAEAEGAGKREVADHSTGRAASIRDALRPLLLCHPNRR